MNDLKALTRYIQKTLGVNHVSLPRDWSVPVAEPTPEIGVRTFTIGLLNFGPKLNALPPSVQEMALRLKDAIAKEAQKKLESDVEVQWIDEDASSEFANGFHLVFAFGGTGHPAVPSEARNSAMMTNAAKAVLAPSLIEMAESAQLKKVGWASIQTALSKVSH